MRNSVKYVSAAALFVATGLAVHVSADDVEQCEGANCADTVINNLNHRCDSPGAACGSEDDCVCKDVNGGIWSDCYCLKSDVTRECTNGCGGGWVVKNTKSVAFEPGAVIDFGFVESGRNFLMSFDFGDVDDDGVLRRFDVLEDDPRAIAGSFSVEIGERVGSYATATMTSADFRVDCPLPIFRNQSFDNAVRSDGRNTEITGLYNFETGELHWDNALTLSLESTLFTQGVDLKVRPTITPLDDEGNFFLHVSTYVTRPGYLRCSHADVAEPLGVLDFDDISMFLDAYAKQAVLADLAEPFGVVDERDMNTFIKEFTHGCPTSAP